MVEYLRSREGLVNNDSKVEKNWGVSIYNFNYLCKIVYRGSFAHFETETYVVPCLFGCIYLVAI